MLNKITEHLDRYPRPFLFACLPLMVGVITYIDWETGPNIKIANWYVLPVAFAAWQLGRTGGYVTAAMAMTAWYFVSISFDHDSFIRKEFGWNIGTRVVFYYCVTNVLAALRESRDLLEKKVRERTAALEQEVAKRLQIEAGSRELAVKLSVAEEDQRRRLATELHDAVGQMLSLLKINLETAVAESAIDSHQHERLLDAVKTVDGLISQTRSLTFELHPSILDDLGLVAALEWFVGQFKLRTLADISLTEVGERRVLPLSLASYLFRSVKELAGNAVKHGNAREIVIGIHWSDEKLRIVVDDSGSGFDVQAALTPGKRNGLGLAGIEERLGFLGGRLSMESTPGEGTRAIMDIPMSSVDMPRVLLTASRTIEKVELATISHQ